MKKKLFAFWRYDQFPYVLGSEITDMNNDGQVETTRYGKGQWFKPFKIVPVLEGERIMNDLHILKLGRMEAMALAGQPFEDKARKILVIPPLTFP